MLETFDAQRLASAATDSVGDLLEQGNIIQFIPNPIELPDSDELELLRNELPKQLKLKNVSYHPEADQVKGLHDDSPIAELVYRSLTSHRDRVTAFLHSVMPTLTRGMNVGTCSFRPMQEQGRDLKPHASNELIHVDAGAYGATNGNRLLRFFVNVNPVEDRVWSTKGALPELLQRYGEQAGVTAEEVGRLEKGLADKLRSSALDGISKAGLPLAKVLDSSPYDRAMRRFHNFMKDTPALSGRPGGSP